MAKFPAMPLWTDAYLADTTHLTATQHGAFLLLLISMWRAKRQVLPNDDRLLAKYARLSLKQWTNVRPVIMPFFNDLGNVLSNDRLDDEYAFVQR